jgi:hypothetical protein
MYPAFTTLAGELEVLDNVGLVRLLGVDARIGKRAGKQPPRRTDKRQALYILAISGLFAHQHHWGVGMTVPEDGLRRILVQRTTTTVACRVCQ